MPDLELHSWFCTLPSHCLHRRMQCLSTAQDHLDGLVVLFSIENKDARQSWPHVRTNVICAKQLLRLDNDVKSNLITSYLITV